MSLDPDAMSVPSGENTTEAEEDVIGLDSWAVRYSEVLDCEGLTWNGPVAVAEEPLEIPAHDGSLKSLIA